MTEPRTQAGKALLSGPFVTQGIALYGFRNPGMDLTPEVVRSLRDIEAEARSAALDAVGTWALDNHYVPDGGSPKDPDVVGFDALISAIASLRVPS